MLAKTGLLDYGRSPCCVSSWSETLRTPILANNWTQASSNWRIYNNNWPSFPLRPRPMLEQSIMVPANSLERGTAVANPVRFTCWSAGKSHNRHSKSVPAPFRYWLVRTGDSRSLPDITKANDVEPWLNGLSVPTIPSLGDRLSIDCGNTILVPALLDRPTILVGWANSPLTPSYLTGSPANCKTMVNRGSICIV